MWLKWKIQCWQCCTGDEKRYKTATRHFLFASKEIPYCYNRQKNRNIRVINSLSSQFLISMTREACGNMSCMIFVRMISLLCVFEQKASPGVRVGVIDNPSSKPSEDNTVLYRAIWASLLTQKNKAAADFVQKLLKEESIQLLQQGTKMKDLLLQVRTGQNTAFKFFLVLFFFSVQRSSDSIHFLWICEHFSNQISVDWLWSRGSVIEILSYSLKPYFPDHTGSIAFKWYKLLNDRFKFYS